MFCARLRTTRASRATKFSTRLRSVSSTRKRHTTVRSFVIWGGVRPIRCVSFEIAEARSLLMGCPSSTIASSVIARIHCTFLRDMGVVSVRSVVLVLKSPRPGFCSWVVLPQQLPLLLSRAGSHRACLLIVGNVLYTFDAVFEAVKSLEQRKIRDWNNRDASPECC